MKFYNIVSIAGLYSSVSDQYNALDSNTTLWSGQRIILGTKGVLGVFCIEYLCQKISILLGNGFFSLLGYN